MEFMKVQFRWGFREKSWDFSDLRLPRLFLSLYKMLFMSKLELSSLIGCCVSISTTIGGLDFCRLSYFHGISNDAGLMCPQPKILGCCAPWTKRPLDILPLTNVSRPWTASSMELASSATIAASVGLRHLWISEASGQLRLPPWPGLLNWGPSVGCTLSPHIELHRFAALKRATVGSQVSIRSIISEFRMGWFRQGQNSQLTLYPRDATYRNFRLGTHRSGTN